MPTATPFTESVVLRSSDGSDTSLGLEEPLMGQVGAPRAHPLAKRTSAVGRCPSSRLAASAGRSNVATPGTAPTSSRQQCEAGLRRVPEHFSAVVVHNERPEDKTN